MFNDVSSYWCPVHDCRVLLRSQTLENGPPGSTWRHRLSISGAEKGDFLLLIVEYGDKLCICFAGLRTILLDVKCNIISCFFSQIRLAGAPSAFLDQVLAKTGGLVTACSFSHPKLSWTKYSFFRWLPLTCLGWWWLEGTMPSTCSLSSRLRSRTIAQNRSEEIQ